MKFFYFIYCKFLYKSPACFKHSQQIKALFKNVRLSDDYLIRTQELVSWPGLLLILSQTFVCEASCLEPSFLEWSTGTWNSSDTASRGATPCPVKAAGSLSKSLELTSEWVSLPGITAHLRTFPRDQVLSRMKLGDCQRTHLKLLAVHPGNCFQAQWRYVT